MKLFNSMRGISRSDSAFNPGSPVLPFQADRSLRRCITAASGLALGAMSSLAFGLGLGELRTTSYLGQPLNAEIELVSLDASVDLERLVVRRVSAEEAKAMGVDIPYAPYQFDLELEASSGNPRVSVASGNPIREPYLSLLIELRWPTGVVYREYPILLDPPPAVSAAPSARTNQAAAPAQVSTASASRQRAAAPVVRLQALPTDDGTYQVQPGDSLSRIAERWREGTSQGIGETVQWLHQNNPQAFVRGDIDQLKAGAILQMPDLSAYRLADEEAQQVAEPAQSVGQRPSGAVARPGAQAGQDADGRVGQDAARADAGAGLLTVGAADRDDRAREMIDLLVRENEALKQRVEKLENSEYLDTLKQLIVLQRQQIADLRRELGVEDDAAVAQVDTLLAEVGVRPLAVGGNEQAGPTAAASSEMAEPQEVDAAPRQQTDATGGDAGSAAGPLNIDAAPATPAEKSGSGWFIWFVIGAGLLLAALFAAMYAYYRKLVPVRDYEEEYPDSIAPEGHERGAEATALFAGASTREQTDEITHSQSPSAAAGSARGLGDHDWMGEKVEAIDPDEFSLKPEIEDDVQDDFDAIALDEEALSNLERTREESSAAEDWANDDTPALPEGPPPVDAGSKPAPDKPARRPDDEVKMSIAEKMSQYNPEEYRQELESLGFLELDEFTDLDDTEEDEVEAIIYRAMMFCEFKKFDKAVDLLESKMESDSDPRLGEAMDKVQTLRDDSSKGSKKVS